MAEHVRRLAEEGSVLRNYTDNELTDLVLNDLKATDLERELVARLLDHKSNRRICDDCGAERGVKKV